MVLYIHPFLKEILLKGVSLLNNSELILKLVEMLIESEKKNEQKSSDIQNNQEKD